ncbi:MAG: GNAT family N-acetyltransferase [Pseudomonadota bacterium]
MTARHERPTPGAATALALSLVERLPRLTTERLILRAPTLSDFPACAEIACAERARFVGGPMRREDAWYEFSRMTAGWLLHGHGGFTIEDRATGEIYGFVILGLEPGDQEVELGFSVTEAGEGKGIAFEAALAIRDWGWRELGLTGLVSYIDPQNARSIALATRLKAERDPSAEAALGGDDTFVFRHPMPEALQ